MLESLADEGDELNSFMWHKLGASKDGSKERRFIQQQRISDIDNSNEPDARIKAHQEFYDCPRKKDDIDQCTRWLDNASNRRFRQLTIFKSKKFSHALAGSGRLIFRVRIRVDGETC
jgi:hypothetical protein